MSSDKPYHHGDLRAALLAAAEAELAERGVEGFSLRQVAKRAGVSHAAPAHHFRDAQGLLTALATEGFRQFLSAQHAREAQAAPDPRAQLMAAGLGYVDFAQARPALFGLIFGSAKPDHGDADLASAARAAFTHLQMQVAALGKGQETLLSVWGLTHGFASLLSAGRLWVLDPLSKVQKEALFLGMVGRIIDHS